MAFEEKKLRNKIWQRYSFFASGDGAVANMDEDFTIDGDFELEDIRLHFQECVPLIFILEQLLVQ